MGLLYKVGLHIITGVMYWWHGPLPSSKMNNTMIFQGALQVGLKTESECEQNWGTNPLLERTPTVQSPKVQAERGCLTEFCSDTKSATRGSKLYILKAAYHQGMMITKQSLRLLFASPSSLFKIRSIFFFGGVRRLNLVVHFFMLMNIVRRFRYIEN